MSMFHTGIRPALLAVVFGATLCAVPSVAAAQAAQGGDGRLVMRPSQPAAPARVYAEAGDAEQVRRQFTELLDKYPPSLGRVLKLDPSLMSNAEYLTPYPGVAAFLQQHPEVTHNPEFFLGQVSGGGDSVSPQSLARQDFMSMVGNLTAFLVFLVVTGVIIWLIRLFVDHRRWNRLSKIQTDVHTKLLDRFSTNEDLLAYIQTPAGRRFLESAPIPLHDESRPLGAPFSRILWSVQAGIVLAIGGLGILLVSRRFVEEPAQFFFVVGMTTLALGAGFVVSAVAAYALSQRLGLLDKPASDHA